MDKDLRQKLTKCFELEDKLTTLYFKYSDIYHEDLSFWQMLGEEENKHAAIFNSLINGLVDIKQYPSELLEVDKSELDEVNSKIDLLLNNLKTSTIPKEKAYEFALIIEHKSVELIFQKVGVNKLDDKAHRLFRNMVKEEKDHIIKMKEYFARYEFQFTVNHRSKIPDI